MSSPAVTVSSGASLPAVAKMMDDERVMRLPVVDEQGRLVGIVSRSDLLRVYLRDDAAIRDEIRAHVLRRTLWIDPETITVAVERDVTLAGIADRRSTAQIAAAPRRSPRGCARVSRAWWRWSTRSRTTITTRQIFTATTSWAQP